MIGPAAMMSSATLMGILFGLGAAVAQSVSYIFSRLFVAHQHRGVLRLLVLAHILMGAASLALAAVLWSPNTPGIAFLFRPLASTVGFYLLGQVGLFITLRFADASRVSPLLAMKVIILAVLSAAFLRQNVEWLQWAAVLLSAAAAFVLNASGGSLPLKALAGIALTCLFYCISDLSIAELVIVIRANGVEPFRASLLATFFSYVLCGVVGLALLPWSGKGERADWKWAAPFAAAWLVGMVCLFTCFGAVGVVYGNILQSTRGLFSILIGAKLAGMGLVHLERKHPRHVVLRRLGAAAMMCAAIALYRVTPRDWGDIFACVTAVFR